MTYLIFNKSLANIKHVLDNLLFHYEVYSILMEVLNKYLKMGHNELSKTFIMPKYMMLQAPISTIKCYYTTFMV